MQGLGISTGKAARILGVSQVYVTRLVAGGRLKAVKTDLGYLVDTDDLARMAEERRTKSERRRTGKSAATNG
jgi:excisionase family DNA binding protein